MTEPHSKYSSCEHCSLPITAPYALEVSGETKVFCCLGCRSVYQVLTSQGMDYYYELKAQGASFRPPSPARGSEDYQRYQYFNQAEFQKDYLENLGETKRLKLYLEGVHCQACLWLLENLPQHLEWVVEARLDLSKSIIQLTFLASGQEKLSQIPSLIHSWGYRPHPLTPAGESQTLQDLGLKEERRMLTRIGVAGFGAGNIMIYAVSIYGGADGHYAKFFGLITLLLALPVLCYSAIPFYRSAIGYLKAGKISIDLPIAFALIVGGIHGAWNALKGIPHNYFDTLTILVFLLLFSRYAVKRMGQTGLDRNLASNFFRAKTLLRQTPQGEFEEISAEYARKGDIIKVKSGDTLAIDGNIIQGESMLNCSVLTGEPLPQAVRKNDLVYSGSVNQGQELLIKVSAVGEKTKWGETLKKIENMGGEKAGIVRQMDKVAQRLVLIVFTLSAILLITFYLQGDLSEGAKRALALIIITCPCALGLATPLAMARGLAQTAFEGIIVKSEEVLERLSKIKKVFLDKTGTITQGVLEIELMEREDDVKEKLKHYFPNHPAPLFSLIHELEADSQHPLARALLRYAERKGPQSFPHLKLEQRKEVFGQGPSAKKNNLTWSIGRSQTETECEDPLSLSVDLSVQHPNGKNEKIASFRAQDSLSPKAAVELKTLQNLTGGSALTILTGDKKKRAEALAEELKKEQKNLNLEVLAELTPEEKFKAIEKEPQSLMIGDGANDALAFSKAMVGMAVFGSADLGLRTADIFLTRPGLSLASRAVFLSQKTLKLVKRNITFSICYNIVGASAAVLGYVSPLWAAIFMPLSSLTVLFSTLYGLPRHRDGLKQ